MSLFFFFTGPGDPRDLPVLTHPFPTRRSSDLLTGRRRCLSLDDDPTSTSKGTSGFGAYALSGESVDVVVGVWIFAAGFTRKATPSARSEEHTSELQSLMRTSYAVFCLKKKHRCDYNQNKSTTVVLKEPY